MFKKRSNLVNNFGVKLNKVNVLEVQKILPLRLIKSIKKKLRKFFLKKKIKFIINIHYNYIVSYKGKNPRMGKGTGFFVRNAFLLSSNQKVFTTTNMSSSRILKLKNHLKKEFKLYIN